MNVFSEICNQGGLFIKIKSLLKNENGFTLTEMLVVLVIIGVLVSIAVPNTKNAIDEARVKADIAQGRLIKQSIDLFIITTGSQPKSISNLQKFLGKVTTAQFDHGKNIEVNDENLGSPVFNVDLTTGHVQVMDITKSPPQKVWDSN